MGRKKCNCRRPILPSAIVDIFVNSVFLYDDELFITFNWKDGTKTVTLAELENSVANREGTNNSGNHSTEATASPITSGFCGLYLDDNPPGCLGWLVCNS